MKKLYIVRHAKSTWDETYVSDFERPLNKRGRRDAPMMGRVLLDLGARVDFIRSSTAVRALTTARLLAEAMSFPLANIVAEDSMYGASASALLHGVKKLPDSAGEAMIVAHNPGVHMLAELLAGFPEANFPTCGIVCVELPIDRWQDSASGTGTMKFYEYPKRHSVD